MASITQIKTNFTAGEISPDLLGRGDLRAYENGALALRNLFIFPTGGVRRRAGTVFIANLGSYARLIPYEHSVEATYLLVFTNGAMNVYLDGAFVTSITAPWTSAHLDQLAWTQSADALLIMHPDVPPKKVTRSAAGTWSISDFAWATDVTGNIIYQPYYKFADPGVTLHSPNTTGTVTITASSPIFTPAWVGTRLRVRNTECVIMAYVNAATVTGSAPGPFAATPATNDWSEAAFSPMRGYPASAAFHQDRLVLGGSRSLPNRLWLSRTGDLYNFNLGTGLDDEAIEFGILSDQVNAIRAVVSGRHLQVFTSGAEWMVTGDPLTPTNLQLKRQTRIGSATDRNIPPMDVDGATLFATRTRNEIREFLYTDIEQAYQASDLALLTRDIIKGAVDQDFDKTRRLLFVIREDGKFATLTMFRPEQVAAWTLHETQGLAKSIAVVGARVYLQVYRNGQYLLEEFSDDVLLDSAVRAEVAVPQATWTGLAHLNGMTVRIVADGAVQTDKTVAGGAVTLGVSARSVHIGLAYTHEIMPLPPNVMSMAGGRRMRLVRLTLRLLDTAALHLDTGRGMKAAALPNIPYSGDYAENVYGWRMRASTSLWRIASDAPLPFKLLSLTSELKVN